MRKTLLLPLDDLWLSPKSLSMRTFHGLDYIAGEKSLHLSKEYKVCRVKVDACMTLACRVRFCGSRSLPSVLSLWDVAKMRIRLLYRLLVI
ncbi:MAG: hypothetical protein KAG53_07570 [Endozoicomonadaceae bacterium]|nr:hypothetical protein [Endozoicomonadaceae bacterium]